MGSTNYVSTFIQVAEDCPVPSAQVPPVTAKPTVAALQYELIAGHPYEFTSDDVLFHVYALRHGIPAEAQVEARNMFFAKEQACLRSSPLGKRYGWGIHHDLEGRIALVAAESDQYQEFATDPTLTQRKAMRSKRA